MLQYKPFNVITVNVISRLFLSDVSFAEQYKNPVIRVDHLITLWD